ncbi:hypothetical protein D3C75_1232450 [compost metagenome]
MAREHRRNAWTGRGRIRFIQIQSVEQARTHIEQGDRPDQVHLFDALPERRPAGATREQNQLVMLKQPRERPFRCADSLTYLSL